MMLVKSGIAKVTIATLLVTLWTCVCGQDDSEYLRLQSELELIQWDLQEQCSSMARDQEGFLKGRPDGLRNKINGEVKHANYLRQHSSQLKLYEVDVPYNLKRNWTQFTKCGDALLESNQYYALNVFSNKNLHLKQHDTFELDLGTNTTMMNEGKVNHMLAIARNVSLLENIWTKWVAGTVEFKKWYYASIQYVRQAAIANECDTVSQYWELLSDVPEGYRQARNLFENIKPFYEKLRMFVWKRLERHYNVTFEEALPVYVTGSFQGDDWSGIADIVLPHPQIYYDIKVELDAREIRDFYVLAANCTRNLGLGNLTDGNFFERSTFTAPTCETKLINFCEEQSSSIFTCNSTTMNSYLNAHESVMRLGLTKVNFHAQTRESLRQSPIVEGLSSMASLLACNGMLQSKILPRNIFQDSPERENNRLTLLLLLALRIFPKIAYYHAMDEFRLQLLNSEADLSPERLYNDVKMRIQGLSLPEHAAQSPFQRDEFILSNRPYLSKMMGEFLQFQLLNYYQIDLFEETDASTLFNRDSNFKEFIASIPNDEAMELLRYYFQIDQVDEQPMLAFFAPLEEYFDNAPEEQATFAIKKALYTTTTPAPTTAKSAKKKVAVNLERKLKETRSDLLEVIPANNSTGTVTDATKTQVQAQIGIYIGAGIVAVALMIIAGGLIMQKRRTHQNNRQYNT